MGIKCKLKAEKKRMKNEFDYDDYEEFKEEEC